MDDKYNGWANRETWATHLWLSNDEATYNLVREMASDAEDKYELADQLKSMIEDWFEEFYDTGTPKSLRGMVSDVGSLWRVDWDEIAEAFSEE